MMTRSTYARRLSRLALACGWLALAFVAKAVLAVELPKCDTGAVESKCAAAGVLPPVCSFWAKDDGKDCDSKKMKTRESGNFTREPVPAYLNIATQLAAEESRCWQEYACEYIPLSSTCRQVGEVANYGTVPVYIEVPCPVNEPISPE